MSIINLLPLKPNLPFIAYPAKMMLYPLNVFPLSACMMLNFVRRGCWREIAGGRAFFLFQVLLLVGSCSMHGFFRVQFLQCWQLIQCQDPAMQAAGRDSSFLWHFPQRAQLCILQSGLGCSLEKGLFFGCS